MDAPPQVLERFGVQPDPVLPRRLVPAEATVRRLLARIDGDALDRQQIAGEQWACRKCQYSQHAAFVLGERVEGEPVQGLRVMLDILGELIERASTLADDSSALSESQGPAFHSAHEPEYGPLLRPGQLGRGPAQFARHQVPTRSVGQTGQAP